MKTAKEIVQEQIFLTATAKKFKQNPFEGPDRENSFPRNNLPLRYTFRRQNVCVVPTPQPTHLQSKEYARRERSCFLFTAYLQCKHILM